MIICEEYFKFENKIINGFKVLKNDKYDIYDIYVYTSCKKLGNWQLFLPSKPIQEVKNYFDIQLENRLKELNQTIDWNREETEWIKNIVNNLKNSKC